MTQRDIKVDAFYSAVDTAESWLDSAIDFANKILNDPNVGASNGSREKAIESCVRMTEKVGVLAEKIQRMK